ncbi:basic phospholipase A2 10 [Lingula anatina]|nr:basic phospholipase A2 10 [Lingula anatina]|eukprot:XP_013411539.1 basic phospholipase A2 10 [Lingula anatina]
MFISCLSDHWFTDFLDYGCYCGFDGGGTPVDDIDRCCKAHDECYALIQEECGSLSPYLLPYSATCGMGFKRSLPAHCYPPSSYWLEGRCRYNLCECDRRAAECFTTGKYNLTYFAYDQRLC